MILDLKRLPILETERLRLEPLTADDAEHLFPLMGDPEVLAFWEGPDVDDPDAFAETLRMQVETMSVGKAVYWAMRTLGSEEFVGRCDLFEIDRKHRRGEVSFLLGREAWGQGYALEAMRTVIAYAAVSGLRKLAAHTHLGHRRSETLLTRLGFKEEGLLRGHYLADGERRDCRIFGLLL
jgi:[ribosomal protein S5]-alanine N-acetyltransferase